ncbi:uncharacterized protein LOC142337435 isoform X2 [Convolutriloba macropyga]|uniref:uncharacterized protein LOC142337435 isoform X2 n=1 Tax=Convolutriloba macropyga TaxID=536237 RepID=UPI003F51B992
MSKMVNLNATTAAKISLACSTMSAMLIGFLGNSIIIFLFMFNKGLRNGTNMQLVNVAACYMATSVLHMPACLISISSEPAPFSPLFCKVLQFTNDLIYLQICFATCALVLYQCHSIKQFTLMTSHHQQQQQQQTDNRQQNKHRLKHFLCLSTWLLSGSASVVSQVFNGDCKDLFARYSNFLVSWSLFIGLFVLCSFITLGLLVTTYSRINTARNKLSQRSKQIDMARAISTLDRFSKSVTTSLIIFVQSFFCSTPLAVYRVFADRHVIENGYYSTQCLVQLFFMQAAIFPVLVAYRSVTFRMGFRQLFCAVLSSHNGDNNESLLEELYDSSPRLLPHSKSSQYEAEKALKITAANESFTLTEAVLSDLTPDAAGSLLKQSAPANHTSLKNPNQNGHCLQFDQVSPAGVGVKGGGNRSGRKEGTANLGGINGVGGAGGVSGNSSAIAERNKNISPTEPLIKKENSGNNLNNFVNKRMGGVGGGGGGNDFACEDDDEDEGVGTSYSDEKVFVEITENEVKIHHQTRINGCGDHRSPDIQDNVSSAASIARTSNNNFSTEFDSTGGGSARAISPQDYVTSRNSPFNNDNRCISRTLSDIESKETYI